MEIKSHYWELTEHFPAVKGSWYGYRVEVEDAKGQVWIKTSRYIVPHYRAKRNAQTALRKLIREIEAKPNE